VDLQEESDRFILRADVPGVAAKDIEVSAEDGTLTVRGERPARSALAATASNTLNAPPALFCAVSPCRIRHELRRSRRAMRWRARDRDSEAASSRDQADCGNCQLKSGNLV